MCVQVVARLPQRLKSTFCEEKKILTPKLCSFGTTLFEKKLQKNLKKLQLFSDFKKHCALEEVMNLAYLPRLSKGKSNSTLLGFEGALL